MKYESIHASRLQICSSNEFLVEIVSCTIVQVTITFFNIWKKNIFCFHCLKSAPPKRNCQLRFEVIMTLNCIGHGSTRNVLKLLLHFYGVNIVVGKPTNRSALTKWLSHESRSLYEVSQLYSDVQTYVKCLIVPMIKQPLPTLIRYLVARRQK